MVRAIEDLSGVPGEPEHLALIRQFQGLVLYALTYAPDRELSGTVGQLRKELEKHFGDLACIEHALERDFFTNLYVDRHERLEVLDLLPAKRPVLVHGHIGVGKTVVLRKIEVDLSESEVFRLIYFDLKADAHVFEGVTQEYFDKVFRDYVYRKVYDKFIRTSSSYLQEWPIFKVRVDEGYADFREWVLDAVRYPIDTPDEWQRVLQTDTIASKLRTLDVRASLETLLGFLKEKFFYALCFDNVDRYSITLQRQMLSKSVDLSNHLQIPVIVSIREPNLRRLRAEGAKGDVVLVDYFERLSTGEKTVPVAGLKDASVERLLDQRLQFVGIQDDFRSLGNLFDYLKDRLEVDFDKFRMQVREVLQELARTFTAENAYSYCNQNLRELQIFYFRLSVKLLLNPEEEYSAYELIQQRGLRRLTKLRTYFYKWIVCSGDAAPKGSVRPVDIYGDFETNLTMINLRLLEFIYNWEKQNANQRLQFGTMAEVFHRFGVSKDILRERLELLTRFQDFYELTPIWIDREHTDIKDTTKIELMPMGQYFLETLSPSREYAFWNALTADLAEHVVGAKPTLANTYRDDFKFNVVYNLVERTLLPTLRKELDYFDRNLHTPKDWHGSNIDYLKRFFSIRGRFYADRLLNSVMNTIGFSGLSKEQQRKEEKRFLLLLREIEQLEGYHPSS